MDKQQYIVLRQQNIADNNNRILYQHYRNRTEYPIEYVEFLRALDQYIKRQIDIALGRGQIIYASTVYDQMLLQAIEGLDAYFNIIYVTIETKVETKQSLTIIM